VGVGVGATLPDVVGDGVAPVDSDAVAEVVAVAVAEAVLVALRVAAAVELDERVAGGLGVCEGVAELLGEQATNDAGTALAPEPQHVSPRSADRAHAWSIPDATAT
jgi:hypothetical protein